MLDKVHLTFIYAKTMPTEGVFSLKPSQIPINLYLKTFSFKKHAFSYYYKYSLLCKNAYHYAVKHNGMHSLDRS